MYKDLHATTQHGVHTGLLTNGKAVNELTTKFIECLRQDLDADKASRCLINDERLEVDLCA